MHASCCEGQGTRLFGSLPSFVFTTVPPAAPGAAFTAYVDLYSPATLTFAAPGGVAASLTIDTLWPQAAHVNLMLQLAAPLAAGALELAVRIPSWLAAPAAVSVNGAPFGAPGAPGSYVHVIGAWPAGASVVSLDLPLSWDAALYAGHSQLPPYKRYSYLLGPILMSLEGPWDAASDSLVMPTGLDPSSPAQWLLPAGDGSALHFTVKGTSGAGLIIAKPYFEVNEAGERFSNYPCFS